MPISDQGVSQPRYTLIPRTLIFITRGERVLLLKGAPHKRLWANQYNGIGGHVEQGEDVLTAACRELLEETGLTGSLWLCGIITVDTDRSPGIGIFVFRGEIPTGQIQPSHEGEPQWIPFNEIGTQPLVEDLYILLPHVLTMRPSDPPFAGRSFYNEQGKLILEIKS